MARSGATHGSGPGGLGRAGGRPFQARGRGRLVASQRHGAHAVAVLGVPQRGAIGVRPTGGRPEEDHQSCGGWELHSILDAAKRKT